MKINQENSLISKTKINKKTLKIQSFTEITLALIFFVSICLTNLNFVDIYGFDHKLILAFQKRFYSFATNSFCSEFSTIIDHWVFHPDSFNSLLAFFYFSFVPFIAFKFTIIFNISLALTETINILLYKQPRPFWVFPDIKSFSCSENLSGFSEISYSCLLITLTLVYNLRKFEICSISKSMVILFFGIFLTLFHGFVHYVQGRLFLFQILSAIIWSIISYFLVTIFDNDLDSMTFKLGFVNRKSKKWKIYCLCYILIFYFFIILYLTSIDSNTLINPIYLHNYFLRCKFDPSFLNLCLLKTHDTLCYILALPLISFGSSFIYTNFYNFWFETGLLKKIIRGIIVYIFMKIVLYSKKIIEIYVISLLSEMLFSGLIPLIFGFFLCYIVCPMIFDKIFLFRKMEKPILTFEDERFVNINEKLIINQ